jgi:hypothetical protein
MLDSAWLLVAVWYEDDIILPPPSFTETQHTLGSVAQTLVNVNRLLKMT